jgi:hypothetical protein
MLTIYHFGMLTLWWCYHDTHLPYASQTYAPELDIDQWPAFVALKSVNNVVAEALWKWLRKTCGHNIKDYILEGKTKGFFNPMNGLHMYALVLSLVYSLTCGHTIKKSVQLVMVPDCSART